MDTKPGEIRAGTHPTLVEAIMLTRRDVTAYEDAVAFVTQDVAYHIRSLIRRLRKNYWGVYEEPFDPISKRQKIWIPLTEVMVENVVKNYDLDQKDINFRAKSPEAYETTELVRAKTLEQLDKMHFGELLDELERSTNIDGTGLWKIVDGDKKKGRVFDIMPVDRLNFYIDPTARSIQEAYAVIERAVLTPEMVSNMSGWDNKDQISYIREVPRTDRMLTNRANLGASAEFCEIFERWGTVPSYYVPNKYGTREEQALGGKYEKSPKTIEAHVVVANAYRDPVVLLIEENPTGLKPYEENWCTRISGRWDGKGTAEKVMYLQIWDNEIILLRRNKNTLAQLGVMKVKKGKGITSQMLQRLASTGTIPLTDMGDIEQLVVSEAGSGSYQDEQAVDAWSKKVTSAYETATGEGLPSSTPATNAALQSRAAQSQFQMMREELGMFLQRVFDRHVIPRIAKSIKEGDILRLSADNENFSKLVDRVASYYVYGQAEMLRVRGKLATPQEISAALDQARSKLMNDQALFIETLGEIIEEGCDTKVYITNEEMDTGILTDKLINILNIAPEYRDATIRQIYDTFGLPPPEKNMGPANSALPGTPGAAGPAAPGPGGAPQPSPFGVPAAPGGMATLAPTVPGKI